MKLAIYFMWLLFIISPISANNFDNKNQANNRFNLIQLSDYYDGGGAIIPESFKCIFQHVNDSTRFTPTIDEITCAERIFQKIVIEQFKGDSILKEINVKKIRKCYRQYFGYINNKNHKIIIMVLLNFNVKDAQQNFSWWNKTFVYSTSDFYAKNVRFIEINLINERYEGTFKYANWP